MSYHPNQTKKEDIEQWPHINDPDAKWRMLCHIKTLKDDAVFFPDGFMGPAYCHLCRGFMRLGHKVAANGAVLHPDIVHYIEIHNLCPPTDVIQALETHYNRWLRERKEHAEDAMERK